MTAPTLTIDEAVARFSSLFTRARRQHAAKLRRERREVAHGK